MRCLLFRGLLSRGMVPMGVREIVGWLVLMGGGWVSPICVEEAEPYLFLKGLRIITMNSYRIG